MPDEYDEESELLIQTIVGLVRGIREDLGDEEAVDFQNRLIRAIRNV